MKKDKLCSLLRTYVKDVITPTKEDRDFVTRIYQSFNDLLGMNNCVQIGSYPRYTAIRPLHDLDVLFIMGDWDDRQAFPHLDLKKVAQDFQENYNNPTSLEIEIVVQTHSISFRYIDKKGEEVFAVDVVPALRDGKNEFERNKFRVPEIIQAHRGQRRKEFYEKVQREHRAVQWIKTDPLGYIEVASEINKENEDFRRSVKFVKKWKHECKSVDENFKLKSFHLEQLITENYKKNSSLTIFDSIFKLFTELKGNLEFPHIKDRGDNNKYIDSYITEFTDVQKRLIHQAVDAILKAFENIDELANLDELFNELYYERISDAEAFLFDENIPVLIENEGFKIDGFVKDLDGFRPYKAKLKDCGGIVDTKNQISFQIVEGAQLVDSTKWKVVNDTKSPERRGEITNNSTSQNPEKTAYIGKHYVECFAIKNKVCIAKDRVDVVVRK